MLNSSDSLGSRNGLVLAVWLSFATLTPALLAAEFHVNPTGDDGGDGSPAHPFKTVPRAQKAVRAAAKSGPVTVYLGGTFHLSAPLVFTPEDSGRADAPVVYMAEPGTTATLNGARTLSLKWEPWRGGIVRAAVPEAKGNQASFDQLYLNGQRQVLARYPNYDPVKRMGGLDANALAPERVKRWSRPVGAFVHGMQVHDWGSAHSRIAGVDEDGTPRLEGGGQVNQRPGHAKEVFVENLQEELDAPGEWWLDNAEGWLYCFPPPGAGLTTATVTAARLQQLMEIQGAHGRPVHHLSFRGLSFTGTTRTFLETKERLLRGDWCIYRGGALRLEHTEDVTVEDCRFEELGGNALFVSGYNRRTRITANRFASLGASAICLVGDPTAVRSPQFWDKPWIAAEQLGDLVPGPLTTHYPADCVIEDNLIHDLGFIEKQVAGVFISMSADIRVRHNTIYHIPRAAICINDGAWGGHLIENNDVFDTVRETGDHGPFNSWGRDRHWTGDSRETPTARERSRLDNFKTTVIRHNRLAHWGTHSWGIDLDDGSSNYVVTENLGLGCSVKLREGYYRVVENNIFIGPNPPGKHCCYLGNQDVIRRNIYVNTQPGPCLGLIHARPLEWGETTGNLYFNTRNNEPWVQLDGRVPEGFKPVMLFIEWQAKGLDTNSVFADPQFIDPATGDFRVKDGSPALKLGFRNFSTDDFGVRPATLVAEARAGHQAYDRAPEMVARALRGEDTSSRQPSQRDAKIRSWLGARIKNLAGPGELSASGLSTESGVLLVEVPAGSVAAEAGLEATDVILKVNGANIATVQDLENAVNKLKAQEITFQLSRKQQEHRLVVPRLKAD